ncbi:hypothetical protein F5B22DRAFT_658737 [Xylaria bambusicola]|uniref:uncharacterized protein n=1 Tax=Xylaria bambusicola TaxID=326684 RepID=UPI0020085704|nr:uncharacterized protein F5B22DRAFT_658737 [Xylaria bambusicola]KAI0508959.1 hypothetical protein F5B22DRAFT_658737 [Xylaria bambusicola]
MAPLGATEPHFSDGLEPVAIIGMGCRWPGDSESPSELWDYLEAQRNSYSKFPKDRINSDAFYHPDGNRPGSFKTEGGCFLNSDVRQFDSSFFGIHPKEVLTLDPAQRKFLEVVYETFESAGVPLHKLSGSNTGTFVGNFNYDHQLMHYRDPENALPYSVTGSGITILSNRINYVFNLKGPSMTLDTACSSSLYALHLACSAIQTGDCDAAIVGGTNLILTPECQMFSSVLGAVSPTSVCHTFDSRADGYARADGIGALFVKRLSQAVADGDPIRAVIRGTAFNANGRTGGITHPSPDGQEACIRRAYERAGGLDTSLTGYFECHGTGTPVGDPIEVSAIGRVFADTRTSSMPLLIGSIKSNMGHSEPSSGIAGVMKAVLAVERGIIPPTIGIETLNPNVDLKDGRLKIVTKSTPWPDLPIRRASINSFGYGGSNAHAIVESIDALFPGYRSRHQISKEAHAKTISSVRGRTQEHSSPISDMSLSNGHTNGYSNGHANGYPKEYTNGNQNGHSNGQSNGHTNGHSKNGHANGSGIVVRAAQTKTKFILPFSAHDERTLHANYIALTRRSHQWNIADIAYTLSARRSRLQSRSFIIKGVDDVDSELPSEKPSVVKIPASGAPTLGFVFTGQGAQWPSMGASLMAEYPSCLATVRRLDKYIDEIEEFGRSWSIEEVLKEDPEHSRVHTAELSQPLVTGLQIVLVNLLNQWNIRPQAVIGHSSGEIAAGYAAGLLTEKEAIVAAYLRGKAVAHNRTPGLMMAVGGDISQIQPLVDVFDGRIAVACHNSPESYTLSGDADAVKELKAVLDEKRIFCRTLQTSNNAYHSDHMRALGQQYEENLKIHMPKKDATHIVTKKQSKSRQAQAIFFSSVYGHAAPWSALGSRYWRQNLESPVLFHQGVSELVTRAPVDILVEIGPHGALKGPLLQLAKSMDIASKFPAYLSAISRNSDNVKDILTLAGNLFTKGYDVDLARVNAAENRGGNQYSFGKVITDLPRYQWQYPDEILLYENRYTREWRMRTHPRHDILGSRIPGTNQAEPLWRNKLAVKNVPWLADHRLGKDVVFPSTGYISMVLEAATQIVEAEGLLASDVEYYDVQDVSLSTALIVPEDDFGVETLLTLRPTSLNSVSRHKWLHDFTLTSVVNEEGVDIFVEHCRGRVEIGLENFDFPESRTVSTIQNTASSKKIINAAQWYESFARAGLCYGPMFQGLSDISAIGQTCMTQARIGLEPTAKAMKGESRYILHPATVDAALQLSILAAHKNTATKFKRAFMPTAFESIKVWPRVAARSHTSAESFASATLMGVRGLSANITLLGAEGRRVLDATNVFLTASDQAAPKLIEESSPYTRIEWKPDFGYLSSQIMAHLFPPVVLSDDAVIPSLNHLALHQLIHFKVTHSDVFERGSQQPHLQRLLDWTTEKLAIAATDLDSPASSIMAYSDDHRAQEIERISSALKPLSSEARLMCHLYNHLPAIYSEEMTGIQVALQDNLLLDNYETGQVYKEGNRRLAAAVALLAHQNPDIRILEVGAGTGSATNEILPALKGDSAWRQYSEYRFTDTTPSFLASGEERFSRYGGMTFGTFDMEKSGESQGYEQDWDVVVASNVIHATSDIKSTLLNIRKVLKPGGKLILLELTQSQLSAGLVLGTFSDFWKADYDPNFPRHDGPFLSKSLWQRVLPASGFSGLDFYLDDYAGANVSATVICATAVSDNIGSVAPLNLDTRNKGVTLVYRSEAPTFAQSMANQITKSGDLSVEIRPLADIQAAPFGRFIFLLETQNPFFLNVTAEEWKLLQWALLNASSSLWVTSGDLMAGKEPLQAMISGLARGLKTENNSIRLSTLDLEHIPKDSDVEVFDLIMRLEQRVSDVSKLNDDSEFRYKDGILHVSRLTTDDKLCELSKTTLHVDRAFQKVNFADVGSTPLQLAIQKPGVLSTIHFKPDSEFAKRLAPDEVEIEVKYASINSKDIAVLAGRHHSDSMSDECSGIITKIGSEVTDFQVGDSVYCQSFAKFGNFVRDKAAFCQRLDHGDTFEGTATMPIAFSTAIYGLIDLGRLEKGDTVLIQSATGAVGLAACQIAHMIGAEIFATVGTTEKATKLLSMGFNIGEDHILDSRDKFSAKKLLQQTKGKGIDVILCSARGELMHEYWRCIANCGRFVEIGRTEVLDNGKLSLDVFRRNATFASFDLEVMSKTKPQVTARLMRTIQQLKAEGHIKPLPSTSFSVTEIEKAFMTFTKGAHIGKLLVEYTDSENRGITIETDPYTAKFDPNATYLLVGCLGGLGRSFSTWAVARGARHIIYLSRSGATSVEAKTFLIELEENGVEASVVKGDVSSLADVRAAVQTAKYPIKGVVQGALTLNDSLFESMSLDRFNSTVLPRVIGTLNLHEATKDCPLDFFQLWSSWTVVFGTATQSNYLASNAFLDAFARYRRAQGLPCTSLALSQVLGIGIVSYIPEYQQAMIRNGFYGNDEDDFLQYCDKGILPLTVDVSDEVTFRYDPQTTSHLLVGIEPAGLKNVDQNYPLSDMLWYHDPRFRNLVQATMLLSSSTQGKRDTVVDGGTPLERIVGKISRLLYIPMDEIDVEKAINHYGIDSMVAAELRNWFSATFAKEVSMLKLLSATMTVQKLAEEAVS